MIQPPSSNTKHVLIAERQDSLAKSYEKTLQSAGYKTTVVSTGQKAIKVINESPPDIALLEVLMPELLGTEVCLAMKKKHSLSLVPVILMSQGLKEIDGLQIVKSEYRADDYLLKPFAPEILLDKIQMNLHRKSLKKSPKILMPKDKNDPYIDDVLTMPNLTDTTLESSDLLDQKEKITDQFASTLSKDFSRFNLRAPLNICVNYQNADIFLSSPIMNISKGGMFIRTDIPLPLGKVMKLQFSLPEEKSVLKGSGRVVWIQRPGTESPAGMGIRFKDFGKEDLQTIYQYVHRLKQLVQ